jgi:nonsense-mediated mRNA decay protein 3
MSSGAFCPRCGDPVDDQRSLPGDPTGSAARLCDACYLSDFELVEAPEEIVIDVCNQCGSVRDDRGWVAADRDYTEVAVERTTDALGVHRAVDDFEWGVAPEQVDSNTVVMHCQFAGRVRETAVEAERDVTVRFASDVCDRCSRIAADFYASVVQVRAEGREPTDAELERAVDIANEYIADRERKGDRNAFVSDISETQGGVDVKLSTTQMGRAVADRVQRQLGGRVTDSRTLVTEDGDGNEVYRVTHAVRLPPYPAGTVILPTDGGEPVLVRSARGNLKGVSLTTGEDYEAGAADGTAPEAVRLGDLEDARETTLVTVEDDHAVQVLDPETFEARTIPRPSYLDPDAQTVYVLRHREGLHVLPRDAVEQS